MTVFNRRLRIEVSPMDFVFINTVTTQKPFKPIPRCHASLVDVNSILGPLSRDTCVIQNNIKVVHDAVIESIRWMK